MIEIRLCSIAGARWVDSLPATVTDIVPPKGLGLMFHQVVGELVAEKEMVSSNEFHSFLEKAVLAPTGSEFESADIIASVAHALGSVAFTRQNEDQSEAYIIERFVDGEGKHGQVPRVLRNAGVFSCLTQEQAQSLAVWMDSIDPSEFALEVREMHGHESVQTYLAVARALERIFKSVDVHESDLCCWRSK